MKKELKEEEEAVDLGADDEEEKVKKFSGCRAKPEIEHKKSNNDKSWPNKLAYKKDMKDH